MGGLGLLVSLPGDVGLLVSLPTESLAVRVALASAVAVALAHLMTRAGLRTPRVRAGLALVPGLSVVVVTLLFVGTPALPALWHTVGATGGLTVQVRDTYLSLRPATVPFFIGVWLTIAMVRVAVRWVRHRRTLRGLADVRGTGDRPPVALVQLTRRLAAALRITAPDVLLVPSLPGGAAVVGMREPVLLLDATLASALDDEELTGVIAHELAHVQRRDNHVAFALCLLRDVLFFVPGSMWSIRVLLRERERAADTVAVELTDRPGALASGLLKVLESRRTSVACSPLLSEGTLVARVEALCDDRPAPNRARRVLEVTGAAVVVVGAVATAATVPGSLAGQQGQREALGLLVSDVEPVAQPTTTSTVFRAFERAGAGATVGPTTAPSTTDDLLSVGDPDLAGAVGFEACRQGLAACRDRTGLTRVTMPPQPIPRIEGSADEWQLEPIVSSDSRENALFWIGRGSAG